MTLTARARRIGILAAVVFLLGFSTLFGAPRAAAEPLGGCGEPPVPELVSSGMTGAIDPTTGQGLADSIYLQYGYAGQVWHIFDAGDEPLCAAPEAEISTWVGNFLFDGAKVLVATANSLHYMIHEGGIGSQFDQAVKVGAQAAYQGFAAPFMVIALLLVGIGVFWYALKGDNSGAAKSGGRVAAGLALVAATAFSPLLYTNLFDKLILGGFKQAQEQMYDALSSNEDVVYREVLPTTLHQEIVYKNWLRGEFGSPNSDLAKKLGEDLVWAQACSWSEVRYDTCDVEAKQKKFKEIAKKVKSSGNYATFTGVDGSRVGTGALALFEAGIITPLQIVSKLGILLGQLVLRVVVLFGPILGILAMGRGVARRILKGVLGVGALALFLNIIASVHTYIVIQILHTDLALANKLVVITLITLLIWAVARPFKRVKSMMASSMYAMPGEGLHRAADWLRHTRMMHALRKKHRRHHRPHFDKDFWLSKDSVAEPPGGYGDDSPGTVYATATRPEADTPNRAGRAAAPALASGTRGSSDSGAHGAGTGGPPPPPPGPRGDAPSGFGMAAAAPTGMDGVGEAPQPPPIRAEATRLWEPDGSLYRDVESSPSPQALSAPPAGLPPGTAAETNASPPSEQQSASGERSELIVPSEVLDPRTHVDGPPHAAPRADDPATGQPVHDIYTPSKGRIEQDHYDAPVQGSRPETETPARPDQEGDSDASSY